MNRLTSFVCRCAVILLMAPFLIGASPPAIAPTPKPSLPRAVQMEGLPSPEGLAIDLLDEFERVYNARDAEAYAAMFDPWVFSYEFSPRDAQWGAPEAWAYAQEVRAAQKMFADPLTTVVDLNMRLEEVSAASTVDPVPIDLDGVWKATAAVYLAVERETAAGSTDSHRLHGQIHEFYFRRGTEDEGRAWRIVYWRDMTSREPLLTWEVLKARY